MQWEFQYFLVLDILLNLLNPTNLSTLGISDLSRDLESPPRPSRNPLVLMNLRCYQDTERERQGNCLLSLCYRSVGWMGSCYGFLLHDTEAPNCRIFVLSFGIAGEIVDWNAELMNEFDESKEIVVRVTIPRMP